MEWIITCKTTGKDGYNVFGAFDELQEIDWRKSFNIKTNDIVYIYVSAPYSKIMYKTVCIKESVPKDEIINDTKFQNSYINNTTENCMRLKKLVFLDDNDLSIEKLRELNYVKTNIQGTFKSENFPSLFDYLNLKFNKHLGIIKSSDYVINEHDERVITFPCGQSYDFSIKNQVHTHPLKAGYPTEVPKYMALRATGSVINEVFIIDKVIDIYPNTLDFLQFNLNLDDVTKLKNYIKDRYREYGFSHPNTVYRFYLLKSFHKLETTYQCKQAYRSTKYFNLFELTNKSVINNKVLFCNIAYMKYYNGIDKNDLPVNGGQYIEDTGDALEKFNFQNCSDNYLRGFVETKYRGGYNSINKIANELHIEKIDSNYKNKNSISNVTVVFCARSPILEKTVIVGWYKNATVYRNRELFGTREYNIICSVDNGTLLKEDDRTYVVPRANNDGIGFGQSNLWYSNTNKEQIDFASKVLEYIYNKTDNNSFVGTTINTNRIIKDNTIIDTLINDSISNNKINTTALVTYSSSPILRGMPEIRQGGEKIYKRDRKVAINALIIANHKCEINTEHSTFVRKHDGLPYMESHHLIPMAYQDDFEYSLDVEENIVSLCSHCHNEIHYGLNAKELVTKLYNGRINLLKNKKIAISLEQLLKYYNITED